VLQESTNLVSWVNVSTNLASMAGLLQFTNTYNPATPQKFFRLSSP